MRKEGRELGMVEVAWYGMRHSLAVRIQTGKVGKVGMCFFACESGLVSSRRVL